MKFKESALAHRYLDGLDGLEIGGSAHNPFGLKTRNVDYTADMTTRFKLAEIEMCGEALPVDIVAPGDCLPLEAYSVDFVISSHVLEHFWDPIGALIEWDRVVRPGGYIMAIVPKPDAAPEDAGKPITTFAELYRRHSEPPPPYFNHGSHWSIWDSMTGGEFLLDTIRLFALPWRLVALHDTDDKVGNGWSFLARKEAP